MVAAIQVPGPHTLQPGNFVRRSGCRRFHGVSRRPGQMTAIGPGCRQNAFKLHCGNHVGKASIAEVIQGAWIKGDKSRCQDDRAHTQMDLFDAVIEIDGLGGAELLTCLAPSVLEINAGGRIDGVFQGYGLIVGHIDGLALDELFVEGVNDLLGAFFRAQAAGDAFVHIHVARLLNDLDGKAALMPGNCPDLAQGEQFDVWMPADLDQFG